MSGSCPSAGAISTQTRPAKSEGQPRRPPSTERRWHATRVSRRRATTVQAAPTWKGIVETAEEHEASLIVLGSHRHSGLMGHFHGNVAAAVIARGNFSVLVVHPRSAIGGP